jgi:formylglycine-generating enzyme required for sulfatase activity
MLNCSRTAAGADPSEKIAGADPLSSAERPLRPRSNPVRLSRLLLFLALAIPAALPVRAEHQPRGKKYALLIGVRKYDPKTLRPLPYSENDINDLAAVLERTGYSHDDITILTESVGAGDFQLLPLGKNIRARLGIPEKPGQPFKRGLALGPLDASDSIIVGLAGHGCQFDPEGESYFCPMDADLTDESSLIPFSDIARALDGCKAGLKLLLVDACRNNPQILANRAGERPVVDLPSLSRPFVKNPPGGTALFFSCSPGEVAFEDPDVKHGIFFDHVIKGLDGEADRDGDGKVDVSELAAFAPKEVALHVARKYRVEQTVQVVSNVRGAAALVDLGRSGLAKALTNSIGMKLVLIPAGEFMMGAADGEPEAEDREKPQHRVRISRPFYLGAHEVTQRQYWDVTGTNPSWFSADGGGKDKVAGNETGGYPVEQVSWFDAVSFCNKLSEKEGLTLRYALEGDRVELRTGTGYRLPTEAEWEYACRAGTETPFAFGPRLSQTEANFNGLGTYNGSARGTSGVVTTVVGSYRPNAFGLYDMHGNVSEWCWDGYEGEDYAGSASVDPAVEPNASTQRVSRGGSWSIDPQCARSAYRIGNDPAARHAGQGFRVVRVR